jgi:hypothetical protein
MKAFPSKHPIAETMGFHADGMDLRDYFAAHAMQGLLSAIGQYTTGFPKGTSFAEITAYDAYWIASEMMEMRNKSFDELDAMAKK